MKRRIDGRRKSSQRRFEALESRRLLAGDMTNPVNPFDVNDDAKVSATDALVIINYLAKQNGSSEPSTEGGGTSIYPDTNGNGIVAASDALRVINALAEGEQVSAPAPDLVVTAASVDEYLGTIWVANNGDTSAPLNSAVHVSVLDVGPESRVVELGTFPVQFQANESTTSITASFHELVEQEVPNGTYQVQFTVDPNDEVDETDENNDATFPLLLEGFASEYSIEFKTGNNPHVKFDGTNTRIHVSSTEAGDLRFRIGEELDRTISIRHDLWIKSYGENNKWLFDGAEIPDDLFVYFEGTDNTVSLDDTYVGDDFIFKGSHGVDNVIIAGGSKIRSAAIIKTKSGDDSVLVQNASIWHDFIFYGGDGNDMFATVNTSFGDDLVVRMQDGMDQVSLQDINVKDVASLHGGKHVDSLANDGVHARVFRQYDFETSAELKDVAALIDELCGEGVREGNGDTEQSDREYAVT